MSRNAPSARRPLARARLAALLAACVASISLATSPAQAQRNPDELAREHFESGKAYFAEAEYHDALRAFEKAYALSHRSLILLDISVVQERLTNLSAAIAALDQFLELTPDAPDAETIRKRRDNLQKRLENQQQAVLLPEQSEQTADATAADRPEAGPNKDAQSLLSPAGVAFSVGAIAALGAVGTGIGAWSEYSRLKNECNRSCSESQTRTGQNLALTSTVLTGVALLGVGIGAWLWFEPFSDDTQSVSLMPLPGGGFAQARFRF